MLKYLIPVRIRVISIDIAYYTLVVFHQLIRFRGPKGLLKANYGIDHGGHAFASKFAIQEYVGHEQFPATIFIRQGDTTTKEVLIQFGRKHGYPIVLKPDNGYVGKGIFKIDMESDIETHLSKLQVDYIAQAFVPGDIEFGLFYVRNQDGVSIPSINQKYYPYVVGDSVSSILDLAKKDPCYTDHWQTFLKDVDLDEVVPDGEKKILSFIGSNTLGSKFIDVSHYASDALRKRLADVFNQAPGINFSRLDVKASSVESFEAGEFTIIEVNGVASQPTNMLDIKNTPWDIFKIQNKHALLLVKTAHHHRAEQMDIMGWVSFLRKTKNLMKGVEGQHALVHDTQFDFFR